MKKTYSIHGMTCSGCAETVRRALSSVEHINNASVDLERSNAEIDMDTPVPLGTLQEALKSYAAYHISEPGTQHEKITGGFWYDQKIWSRASFNTLHCLIGCSIGDFGMIIFLQGYYPSTSMMMQMILATVAGLITSVLLETVLLKKRENFNWALAFQTALSMSFMSMVAMELVMNITDFMITGGKAAFDNPVYWTALIAAMMTGFLAPLPYNYYKLKKFDKACH